MKFVGRFFSQILVFIFVITACMSLCVLTFLKGTEHLVSVDNIIRLVKQLDFKELMGSEIEGQIYELLEQTGLPSEYVDYILENDQIKEYMGSYIAQGIEYILYDKKIPIVEEKEVTEIISNSFDQMIQELENNNIEVSTYLSKEDQELIHQKIEYYVPEIVEKIPEAEKLIENKISENKDVQNAKKKLEKFREIVFIVQKIYQFRPFISIAIIVQLGLIIVLKLGRFHFIKWLLLPFIGTSFILKLLNTKIPTFIKSHYPIELNFMKDFIDDIMQPIYTVFSTTANLCFVIAILFIVLQLLLWGLKIYNNRRKKDMATL